MIVADGGQQGPGFYIAVDRFIEREQARNPTKLTQQSMTPSQYEVTTIAGTRH